MDVTELNTERGGRDRWELGGVSHSVDSYSEARKYTRIGIEVSTVEVWRRSLEQRQEVKTRCSAVRACHPTCNVTAPRVRA